VCPCSGAIPHYLVFWGGLCCISVSSPPFFIIEGLQCIQMYFEGAEEMRGSRVHVPELFHIIWFWEGYAVSWSVLHHFFSLKACFQCIQVLFEGSEETSGAHHSVLKIFHIIWFWEGYALSW